jgi:hypothetical protein
VLLWEDTVDPATEEGCEALCAALAWGDLDAIHSCDADTADTVDTGERAAASRSPASPAGRTTASAVGTPPSPSARQLCGDPIAA